MDIAIGSLWRNRKSGVVSEVLRVEKNDVVMRLGKSGERKKYRPHFALDYAPADEPFVAKPPSKAARIAALEAQVARLTMMVPSRGEIDAMCTGLGGRVVCSFLDRYAAAIGGKDA